METSSLVCGANQWTGFYMITASVMKGLKHFLDIDAMQKLVAHSSILRRNTIMNVLLGVLKGK